MQLHWGGEGGRGRGEKGGGRGRGEGLGEYTGYQTDHSSCIDIPLGLVSVVIRITCLTIYWPHHRGRDLKSQCPEKAEH